MIKMRYAKLRKTPPVNKTREKLVSCNCSSRETLALSKTLQLNEKVCLLMISS